MTNRRIAEYTRLACGIGLIAMLSACASRADNVIFVTKTSLGIDIEPGTGSAAIAYDRLEGYSAPRYEDKAPPPVVGSFEYGGNRLTSPSIRQVYATGKAALLVSAPAASAQPMLQVAPVAAAQPLFAASSTPAPSTPAKQASGDAPASMDTPAKVMFFGTGTVIGIKLGMSTNGLDGFTFGFKRKEMSLIPVKRNGTQLPSVLASVEAGTVAEARNAKTDIRQFFATGEAAENLAQNLTIKAAFDDKAKEMLREQGDAALVSLSCVMRVDEAKLPRVWDNLEAHTLVDLTEPSGRRKTLLAATAQEQRIAYAQALQFIDHNVEKNTARLREHRAYVCGLAQH